MTVNDEREEMWKEAVPG